MKSAAVFLVSAVLVAASARAQSVCDAVLNPQVFNAGSTQQVEQFASRFRSAFCNTAWTSEEDLRRRSTQAGFSYESALEVIGLNFTDASSQERRTEAYNQFCSRSAQDIAFSRAFFNQYRSSDTAVNAWRQCIIADTTREGVFAASVEDPNLTGSSIVLTNTRRGAVPPLRVNAISVAGNNRVDCFYGERPVAGADFPQGQAEVSIRCIKAANLQTTFNLDTNWGVVGPFILSGYGGEVNALRAEIALLRSNNEALRSEFTRNFSLLQESLQRVQAGKVSSVALGTGAWGAFVRFTPNVPNVCPDGTVISGIQYGAHNDYRVMCSALQIGRD